MSPSRSPALRIWNRFWFRPVHAHTLSLLRIFFGLVLVLRGLGIYGLYRINRLNPHLPRYEYDSLEMYGAFSMPWPGLEWIPSPDQWWYARIDEALLVLLVLFTVGLFTRVVGLLIAGIYTYVFLASQMNYYHHVWCYTLVVAVLAFSRCDAHYSLDAYLRGPRAPVLSPILPLRLLQVMVSLLYGFTFVSKCNEGWLSGRIMYLFHESESIEGPFHRAVLGLIGYQGLSVFTVCAEGFLAFALWIPRLRALAIAVGIVLHLGIDVVMAQRTFSYQMIALYLVFLDPRAGSTVVLVDSRRQAWRVVGRVVNLFDWLRRTSWRESPAEAGSPAPEGPRVITSEGRVLSGFEAWRHLLLRLPLTFFPGLALYFPGLAPLARWLERRRKPTGFTGVPALEAVGPASVPVERLS